MSWTATIDEQRHGDLRRKVEEAESVWKEVLGPSADLIDVTWRMETEPGPRGPREVLRMSVKDQDEGSRLDDQTFAPEEITLHSHLYDRFNNVWRKLLLSGARTHLERVQGITSQYSGD